MKKQEALKHWITKFRLASAYNMNAIETAIFEGAFECGWDAAETEMIKLCGGSLAEGDYTVVDEFGRTDDQLEFEVNELRERSVQA